MFDNRSGPSNRFWTSRGGVAFCVFLAIIGFYLVTEHTAHLFGALPYLFFLACPLMHVFMHGGHDHESAPTDGEAKQ